MRNLDLGSDTEKQLTKPCRPCRTPASYAYVIILLFSLGTASYCTPCRQTPVARQLETRRQLDRSNTYEAVKSNLLQHLGLSQVPDIDPDTYLLLKHQNDVQVTWATARCHDSAVDPACVSARKLQAALQLTLASPIMMNASFNFPWELRYIKTWQLIDHLQQMRKRVLGGSGQDPTAQAGAATDSSHTSHTATATATADSTLTAVQSGGISCLATHLRTLLRLLSRLPKRLCWPAVRRLTVAELISLRLSTPADAWQEDQAREALALILLQLFAMHRSAVARKGVIEFFHISKAGGTSVCKLAQMSGCATHDFSNKGNCLIKEFDDFPRWASLRRHQALGPPGARARWYVNFEVYRNTAFCHTRKRILGKRSWNMYAHEYTLIGGKTDPASTHVCSEHVAVLQVREPVSRLKSQLRWMFGLYKQHETPANMSLYFPHQPPTAADWEALLPAASHNYYVRSLLGEAVFHMGGDVLGETHLRMAKMMALQFDVVLALEQPSITAQNMRTGLGWLDIPPDGMLHARPHAQLQFLIQAARLADECRGKGDAAGQTSGNTAEQAELREMPEEPQGVETDDSSSRGKRRELGLGAGTGTLIGAGSVLLQAGQDSSTGVAEGAGQQDDEGLPSPDDMRKLVERNRLDVELYDYLQWLPVLDSVVFHAAWGALKGDPFSGMLTQSAGLVADPSLDARSNGTWTGKKLPCGYVSADDPIAAAAAAKAAVARLSELTLCSVLS